MDFEEHYRQRWTGISDHHVVLIVLSRRKLVEALLREFPSLNPWDLAA